MKKLINRMKRPQEDTVNEEFFATEESQSLEQLDLDSTVEPTPEVVINDEPLPSPPVNDAPTPKVINDEPLPSTPVNDAPTSLPVHLGVQYFGTIGTQGASGPGARAALPVAVFREADGSLLGVAVVSDPGCLSSALPARLPTLLEQRQITAPLVTLKTAPALSRSQREAIARVLATQKDPTLDHAGALAALGFMQIGLGL